MSIKKNRKMPKINQYTRASKGETMVAMRSQRDGQPYFKYRGQIFKRVGQDMWIREK